MVHSATVSRKLTNNRVSGYKVYAGDSKPNNNMQHKSIIVQICPNLGLQYNMKTPKNVSKKCPNLPEWEPKYIFHKAILFTMCNRTSCAQVQELP